MDLTVVIPFYEGNQHIRSLLGSLPTHLPVIIVDDCSSSPVSVDPNPNLKVIRLPRKGYFAGAVNLGIRACETDVLVLNQDVLLRGREWLDLLLEKRSRYAMIGERIRGEHPTFGNFGYIHGTFMFLRRDAIEKVGFLDQRHYPLWGNTAEWQLRAARAGFEILPLPEIPGFTHQRGTARFGSSIQKLLEEEPNRKSELIRTPPMVSVIVPCHNYGRYLEDCICSLVGGRTTLGDMPGQTLQSFEIVVVDDASTDDSWEHIRRLMDPAKGFRAYRLAKNVGTAAALNFGIRKSVGKYVTFLSADDMREPRSLEALVEACERNPRHFAYDNITLFGEGKRIKRWKMEDFDFGTLRYRNQIHAGILYPREAWEEVGGYPEIMRDGREDWAFNVGLGSKGWCGVHVEEFNYLYRREQQNRSLKNTTPEHRQIFLDRIVSVFPQAYNKEISEMACCGRSVPAPRPQANIRSNGGGRMASPVPGSQGMVRLRYLGRQMSATWTGFKTHAPYRFGADRSTGWVDNRDVGSRGKEGFLNLKDERGNWLFEVKPSEAQMEPIPEPAEVVEETTQKPAENVRMSEEETPRVEEPKFPQVPDPSNLTVGEVRGLNLSLEGWRRLYSLELASRNRKGVIDYVEQILAGE